jgi:integrase
LAHEIGVHTRFHDLRHFAATQAIAAGIDVRTVAGRLGHADPSITLRVYSHVLAERDRAAAALLGGLVLGPRHPGAAVGAAGFEKEEQDQGGPRTLAGAR